MDLNQLSKAVKILKDSGCAEVFLFGSQASGKATPFSDVDLGVKGLPAQSFFALHFDLERARLEPLFKNMKNVWSDVKTCLLTFIDKK
jgi:predicted nucleotidyltransferase